MNRFSIRGVNTLQKLNVIFGDERTEDEVMAELNRLHMRVKHIHELATMISRKVCDVCPLSRDPVVTSEFSLKIF